MGIISNVKTGFKLSRIKKQLEKEPTPALMGELARHYIHTGKDDSALLLVRKGLRLFPDSEILMSQWSFLRKSHLGDAIRKALDSLEVEPTPENYLTVIDAYERIRDWESQAEYCRQFIKHYPESAAAHRIMGRIRFRRFLHDYAALDGKSTEGAFLKALELDSDDVEAAFELARFYALCGFPVMARPFLGAVLELDPDHEEAKTLAERLDEIPQAQEDEDLLYRLTTIEETREFPFPEIADREAEADEEDAGEWCLTDEDMDIALEVDGVDAVVYLGPEGARVGVVKKVPEERENEDDDKGEMPGPSVEADGDVGGDWHPFAQYLNRVSEAARLASVRMDIGSLEFGIIEGSEGGVLFRSLRKGIAGFHLKDRRSVRKTHKPLLNYVEEMAVVGGRKHD